MIDNEQPTVRSTKFDWTSYQTYDEISAWLDEQLAAHPDVLREVPFGKSHEGRPIRAVHLSRKAGNPAVIIESNIHAREWITSATATWLLNELLTSTDPAVRDLSQNLDWYIIPIFNVDGFAYSHTTVSVKIIARFASHINSFLIRFMLRTGCGANRDTTMRHCATAPI